MEEKQRYRIASVKQETAEAKTYELEQLDGDVNFLPGQFLTFIFHFEHQELRRSYSIVSLPGESLKVTVQRVENGSVSRYILIHWKKETIVEALPPAGRFTLQPVTGYPRDIFFLAAGSGIAPILPQIRYLLKEEAQSIIHLFYSSNTEEKILFRDEIEELKKSNPQLEVTLFISNPKAEWQKRQRLNNGMLEILVREKLKYAPSRAMFLVCGPFTYMRMVRLTLIFMKFEEEQIRSENFLPEIMRSGTRTIPHSVDTTVEIEIKGKQYKVFVKAEQTILRAALKQGILLPYSCEGGICSACAAICKEGKVKMSINEVLSNQDLKEGWILTCTGYPATDEVKIAFK